MKEAWLWAPAAPFPSPVLINTVSPSGGQTYRVTFSGAVTVIAGATSDTQFSIAGKTIDSVAVVSSTQVDVHLTTAGTGVGVGWICLGTPSWVTPPPSVASGSGVTV